MLTCSRCGRENPDSLRSCSDCGHRLQPAVVQPTPPRGIAAEPEGAPRPAAGRTGASCPRCGTGVPVDCRFCTNCGSPIEPVRADLAAAAPRLEPPRPAAAPPLAAPQVPVSMPGGERQANVLCNRCRGSNPRGEATAQFGGARLSRGFSCPAPRQLSRITPQASTSPTGRRAGRRTSRSSSSVARMARRAPRRRRRSRSDRRRPADEGAILPCGSGRFAATTGRLTRKTRPFLCATSNRSTGYMCDFGPPNAFGTGTWCW